MSEPVNELYKAVIGVAQSISNAMKKIFQTVVNFQARRAANAYTRNNAHLNAASQFLMNNGIASKATVPVAKIMQPGLGNILDEGYKYNQSLQNNLANENKKGPTP